MPVFSGKEVDAPDIFENYFVMSEMSEVIKNISLKHIINKLK